MKNKAVIFGVTFTIGAFFCFWSASAATCPAAWGVPYAVPGDRAIYEVTRQCTKQVFDSELKYFSYHNSWSELVGITATGLAKVPWDKVKVIPWGQSYDPKYGALVKTVDNPKVYFVAGGVRRWIENETVYQSLNLPWSWVENVSAAALQRFPEKKTIATATQHPNFTVFKYANKPSVYRLEPDHFDYTRQVKRVINDEAEFKSLGLRWDRILTIGADETYPDSANKSDQIYSGLTCASSRVFNVLVFFDDSSYSVTDKELVDFFAETSEHLFARTCVKMNVLKVWHVTALSENAAMDPVHSLMSQNAALVKQANGFVYFTEKVSCSDTYGGCTSPLSPGDAAVGVGGYCNSFSQPSGYKDRLYGSIVDWDHLYGRCGYDDHENRVSETSFGGECVNTTGLKCVLNNGYYACPNLQNKYYAQHPRMMQMSTVIHEIMHFFGTAGNLDHNETLCSTKYGGTLDEVVCSTADQGECFFNICRYTYENFRQAKNLCQ